MEDTKEQIIEKIQAIVKEYGSFSPFEVGEKDIDLFPNAVSTKKVEFISEDDVTVGHYISDVRVDDDFMEYEELPDNVLSDILLMAENHQVGCGKAMDNSRSEDF